jgi:hypothetical protein
MIFAIIPSKPYEGKEIEQLEKPFDHPSNKVSRRNKENLR